jgi:hypothetical protein
LKGIGWNKIGFHDLAAKRGARALSPHPARRSDV